METCAHISQKTCAAVAIGNGERVSLRYYKRYHLKTVNFLCERKKLSLSFSHNLRLSCNPKDEMECFKGIFMHLRTRRVPRGPNRKQLDEDEREIASTGLTFKLKVRRVLRDVTKFL